MSLRKELGEDNIIEEQKKLLDSIRSVYERDKVPVLSKVEQRNIVLIGKTRTGKSTIKSLLLDPTRIPEELTLFSRTEIPTLDSYYIAGENCVLNIMDTPGLGERGNDEFVARDNEGILNGIDVHINQEFTKLHVLCFCMAITSGMNNHDFEIIQRFMKIFGESASKNSCLIITHCESQNEQNRKKLERELRQDKYFKDIIDYFQLGILFSGALNPDDYNVANETLLGQFSTINRDRRRLIRLFTSVVEPICLNLTQISELKRAREDAKLKETKLAQIRVDLNTRIDEHVKMEDHLRMIDVELNETKSKIDKYEYAVTELRIKCECHKKTEDGHEQALAEQQKQLRKYQTSLEAQKHENKQITEQLEREQQEFHAAQRKLKDIQDNLKVTAASYEAEIVHLRAIQAKLLEQIAVADRKTQEQFQLLEHAHLGENQKRGPSKRGIFGGFRST